MFNVVTGKVGCHAGKACDGLGPLTLLHEQTWTFSVWMKPFSSRWILIPLSSLLTRWWDSLRKHAHDWCSLIILFVFVVCRGSWVYAVYFAFMTRTCKGRLALGPPDLLLRWVRYYQQLCEAQLLSLIQVLAANWSTNTVFREHRY